MDYKKIYESCLTDEYTSGCIYHTASSLSCKKHYTQMPGWIDISRQFVSSWLKDNADKFSADDVWEAAEACLDDWVKKVAKKKLPKSTLTKAQKRQNLKDQYGLSDHQIDLAEACFTPRGDFRRSYEKALAKGDPVKIRFEKSYLDQAIEDAGGATLWQKIFASGFTF